MLAPLCSPCLLLFSVNHTYTVRIHSYPSCISVYFLFPDITPAYLEQMLDLLSRGSVINPYCSSICCLLYSCHSPTVVKDEQDFKGPLVPAVLFWTCTSVTVHLWTDKISSLLNVLMMHQKHFTDDWSCCFNASISIRPDGGGFVWYFGDLGVQVGLFWDVFPAWHLQMILIATLLIALASQKYIYPDILM